MGKGIKIKKARLISSGAIVKVSEFDIQYRDNIECEFCRVKLKYTKGFWRNKEKDNRIWISSFFSLFPGEHHKIFCTNTVKNKIDILVKNSSSVENLENQTIFKDGVTFEFRLHTLDEVIRSAQGQDSISSNSNNDNIRIAPITVSKKLKPYLKTAVELSKLWSLVQSREDQKEIQDKIFLKYKGRKIAWSNFIFETKQLHKLISKTCFHPVAFILELEEEVTIDTNRKNRYCAKAKANNHETGITVPRIYFNKDNIYKKIISKHQYIVIGHFDIKKGQDDFYNLNIFIHDESQINQISEEIIPDYSA